MIDSNVVRTCVECGYTDDMDLTGFGMVDDTCPMCNGYMSTSECIDIENLDDMLL